MRWSQRESRAFAENVFYEFDESKIKTVWSIIEKAAIEAQLYRRGRLNNLAATVLLLQSVLISPSSTLTKSGE